MGGKSTALIILLALIVIGASSVFYTVDEREKAIVLRFGKIIRADDPPGLHIKLPWAEEVRRYDARIQTMDAVPENFFTIEKKNLQVDSFVKWRIKNVFKYFTTVSGSKRSAENRLSQKVNDSLREEFGKRTVQNVISGDRAKIMDVVREATNAEANSIGVEVVDVRLKRVDWDKNILPEVYSRMTAERSRVAKELRAEGAEDAERITADADKQRQVILAEAYRKAEQLKGEGDAKATDVYAKSFGKDKEFYTLYRSLNAYQEAFSSDKDLLIIEPDSEFFKYFKKSKP